MGDLGQERRQRECYQRFRLITILTWQTHISVQALLHRVATFHAFGTLRRSLSHRASSEHIIRRL